MAVMRNQKGRNIKSFVSVSKKYVWPNVPNSIGSCVASLSQTSRRKARTITFSLQKAGSIEVTISLRSHGAWREKIVEIQKGLLFFWNSSWSGEAKECIVKSSLLLSPLENGVGLFIKFLLSNFFIDVYQWRNRWGSIIFVVYSICCIFSKQTDLSWDSACLLHFCLWYDYK